MTTTIATRIRDRAKTAPGGIAMREKDFGIWQEVTWAQYWDHVQDFAHGLLSMGVQPGDRNGQFKLLKQDTLPIGERGIDSS